MNWKFWKKGLSAEEQMALAAGELAMQASLLPAANCYVQYPCGCQSISSKLRHVILHLNDMHSAPDAWCACCPPNPDVWTREDIADWIDDLHDRNIINAEFEPWSVDI